MKVVKEYHIFCPNFSLKELRIGKKEIKIKQFYIQIFLQIQKEYGETETTKDTKGRGCKMQYKVTIEKTDVKHFEFDVDVDMEKVKSWVHEKIGTYQTYVLDNLEEDEEPDCTEDEFYQNQVDEYLEDQDPDLMFIDNVINQQDYQLQTEECSFAQIEYMG